MKTIMATILVILVTTLNAQLLVKSQQSIKNLNEDPNLIYIAVEKGLMQGGQNAQVSYETDDNIKGRTDKIVDADGNTLKFATIAAVINYVSRKGWEFVTDYHGEEPMTKTGKTEFLFRKRS